MPNYLKSIFASMAIIAMGILLINYFQDSTGNLGIIIIAIGGFFFLIGMKNKKKVDKTEKTTNT